MRIVIIHHDLEESEEKMAESFIKKGFSVMLLDVRRAELKDFEGVDLVLNRVYASVANRDYPSIPRTLVLLKKLESNGIRCINSYITSLYDYSKYDTFKLTKKLKMPTPETIFINNKDKIQEISEQSIKKFGFPMIVKRNTGGRGKDISRVDNKKDLIKDLKNKFYSVEEDNYTGGFIIQEFIVPTKDHDCRMGVANGKFIFSYGRTLISSNSKDKWLASQANGSKECLYEATKDQEILGENSTNAIGAEFNEIDMAFGENQEMVIIENNPTPNFMFPEDDDLLENFVNSIIKIVEPNKELAIIKR